MRMQRFGRDRMPAGFEEVAREYRKRVRTRAMRIVGPFVVETREGELFCADGWLAVDADGYPYPVEAGVFERMYEECEE